jgi:hypothetical protein
MSTITSTNDVMVADYTDGEFVPVTADINTALHTLGYLRINIYNDISGNSVALDSSGNPVIDRVIASTRYIYPTTDASGNAVDGFLRIIFDDGTYLDTEDWNNTQYAYVLTGLESEGLKYLT